METDVKNIFRKKETLTGKKFKLREDVVSDDLNHKDQYTIGDLVKKNILNTMKQCVTKYLITMVM
jgi:hypothetical protein